MDAAAWTAVGTFVVAGVTAGLWIAAQKQLKEQRRSNAILHKPFLRPENFQKEEVKVNNEFQCGFTYTLRNIGNGTASDVKVETKATFEGKEIQQGHSYEQPFIPSGDYYTVEVPVDNIIDSAVPGEIVHLCITISFSDLESPNNVLRYSATYGRTDGEFKSKLDSYNNK